MLDRTNVGIPPLMSTPVTTSYVSQIPVTQTVANTVYESVPQTTTFTQEAYPVTSYGGQVVDQGVTIPDTTSYIPETTTTTLTPDALTSFAPEITSPDQALSSFVPETNVQSIVTAPQTSMQTSIVPNVILSQEQQVPPQPQPTATPIMDEDFQRGRPIYDEFSEDRYRGFRFGS